MSVLKKVFEFYINSSIHVALAVFSLTYMTLLELSLGYNKPVLYFIFYASIIGYNFVKYFGIARFHHRQLASWLKYIQILSFICFMVMCYYALKLKIGTLIFISAFALITFLYGVPLLSERKISLRNISGIKVFVIALVWAGATVIIPVLNESQTYDLNILIIAVQRFIFVVVLMLPFEIRDLKYDNENLKTIPQRLGVKRAKIFGITLLVVFFTLEFLKYNKISESYWPILIITLLTAIFLIRAKKNQSKFYSSFGVESLPIIWLLLYLTFN